MEEVDNGTMEEDYIVHEVEPDIESSQGYQIILLNEFFDFIVHLLDRDVVSVLEVHLEGPVSERGRLIAIEVTHVLH